MGRGRDPASNKNQARFAWTAHSGLEFRAESAFSKMTEFTEDQVEAFRDAFELFDRTGEGKIVWQECSSLARCFGYNPTNAYVQCLLGGGDEAELPTKEAMSTNTITLDDFLPILWTISQAPDPGSYEDFFEGLKVFDKDGNGNVNSAELRHVLSSLGEKLQQEEIDILLKGQEDANGNVNYDKFIKTLMSDREESNEAK